MINGTFWVSYDLHKYYIQNNKKFYLVAARLDTSHNFYVHTVGKGTDCSYINDVNIATVEQVEFIKRNAGGTWQKWVSDMLSETTPETSAPRAAMTLTMLQNTCVHVYKTYVGFSHCYEYCIHCDRKQ